MEEKPQPLSAVETIRHSCAHIMAQAVTELYPGTRLWVGPVVEHGFYYDMDVPVRLSEEDLPKIEERMHEIVRADLPLVREDVGLQRAKELWTGDKYKNAILDQLSADAVITTYTQGSFTDLCRGPHVARTGECGFFKLTSLAGAYWAPDPEQPMLQRVYGVAFETQAELDAHLAWLEEVKKRDHRRLGRELELFLIDENVGPGLILWQPKGSLVRTLVMRYMEDLLIQRGYGLVTSPHLARLHLWETSGHTGFYSESMFQPNEVEGQKYQIKPMNCPFHISVYNAHKRSYRELPLRLGEMGTVYRYERSGVLHGTMRVRGFTQDDAHIFCAPESVNAEVAELIDLTWEVLGTFGFQDKQPYLATRPEKSVGDPAKWELATNALVSTMQAKGLQYELDEGGGAFYGPKIDIKIKDSIGREWQLTTIQFDFNLPERFALTYVGEDGQEHQPIMVHRAILGSLERFLGILIEHYAGAFPVWLAPEQIRLLPVSAKFQEGAEQMRRALAAAGLRASLDAQNEKLGAKIRRGTVEKVPYLGVIGEKELAAQTISLRRYGVGDLGALPLAEVSERLRRENAERTLNPA
ncbi:MAG: threonine--tRNA ligase [Myxococcota bacterium]|jgi:threonyl-tRNA synthetase|nr:threonine--tRNA ligase [Myxococcota bacterium]